MIGHLIGWLLVVCMVAALAYAVAYESWLTRRERRELARLDPIDTRPMPPPPPIHFTRDPSPKPRNRSAA